MAAREWLFVATGSGVLPSGMSIEEASLYAADVLIPMQQHRSLGLKRKYLAELFADATTMLILKGLFQKS